MGASWAECRSKKSFWSVNFSYFTQQWTIPQSDCDVLWIVDFLWQPVTTSSVAEPKRSSKAIPEAKLAPKKGHDHCLLFCCHSCLLQLSVPGETIRTEKYAQQIDEMHPNWKACSQHWSKRRAQFFSMTTPDSMSHKQHVKSWRIGLQSLASSAIFT